MLNVRDDAFYFIKKPNGGFVWNVLQILLGMIDRVMGSPESCIIGIFFDVRSW